MATALAVAVAGCGGGGGDGPTDPGGGGGGGGTPPATSSVSVQDDFFNPSSNIVSPGTTVTWTWNGSNPHNVTFANGAIGDSGTQTSGTFSAAMPTALGDYDYQCTIHNGMDGTVTVQ